jgi:hypothetical protein
MSGPDRWAGEVDAFIARFAERAARRDDYPGDFEAVAEPWTDADHPDPALADAERLGLTPDAAIVIVRDKMGQRHA